MTATWCIAVIRPGDLKDSIAAVAAGGGRTSNSRCRPHCSRSGSSAAAPPAIGIKGTADVHGVASAITRSPGGQENAFAADRRQSEPNVCCPSVRPVATDPLLTAGRPNWAPQSCHWQLQNSNVSLCSGSSRRAGVQPIRRRRALALLPGIRRGAARWTATHSSPVSAINDFIEYNAADAGASTWPHSPFAI
jgi:hypothetical protein